MSFYWGRFDAQSETFDDEVKDIYKRRDVVLPSNPYKENVDINDVLPHGDTSPIIGINRIALSYPIDKVWDKMTEDERVEQGLPSKLLLWMMSPTEVVVVTFLGGKYRQ